jgi:hypothetical protein
VPKLAKPILFLITASSFFPVNVIAKSHQVRRSASIAPWYSRYQGVVIPTCTSELSAPSQDSKSYKRGFATGGTYERDSKDSFEREHDAGNEVIADTTQ